MNAKSLGEIMAFDTRRTLLAKIHIAKKDLSLDDSAYRAVLARYGVESSGGLDMRGLEKLLTHFEQLGWVSTPKQAKPRINAEHIAVPDSSPHARQKRYALALAKALDWSLVGLQKRIKRQFGVENILWLNDQTSLQTLIKDMTNRCRRKGIDPSPDKMGAA
jgi:phage gp16-like protein